MGWVVIVTPRPSFTPRRRTLGTHCTGGWVGLGAGLDTEAIGKILCLCWRSNPGCPVCSQILYWLSYLSWRDPVWRRNILFSMAGVLALCPNSQTGEPPPVGCTAVSIWTLFKWDNSHIYLGERLSLLRGEISGLHGEEYKPDCRLGFCVV
jgi:hypothetical protein